MNVDVAVIGAGIQGAGVAQALVSAGYSVAILEKNFPASGTSSKSSKLIHGGLRYLESGQFKLVRECLHERHLLLTNAPDLVRLRKFYIPIYQHTSRSSWHIRAGLSLYYALSGFASSGQFKAVRKQSWDNLDGLKTENLNSVFQYWDAQTDDTLLTQAVLHSAQQLGAELLCPALFTRSERAGNDWNVFYELDGKSAELRARAVVNAAGPWVNQVLGNLTAEVNKNAIELVQGTHIVVPETTAQGIYYIEAPDRRAVFVMPWGKQTLIGTTEKSFSGDPDQVQASEEEINYLLATAQGYFDKFNNYTSRSISESFAGLRVLPGGEGGAFSKARDTVIYEDIAEAPGFITLYGGKLTAYRATAEQVFHKVLPYLPKKNTRCETKSLKLSLP